MLPLFYIDIIVDILLKTLSVVLVFLTFRWHFSIRFGFVSEPAYTDYHQIRGTSLVIYKRKNSGAFQVRMNIEGVKGYIVKSSKKKSLDEAIETAEVMYEDYLISGSSNRMGQRTLYAKPLERTLPSDR